MILIFGGTGRTGSAIKSLGVKGHFAGRSDCDLRDVTQVRNCLDKYDPDQVVHLAATCGSSNASRAYEYYYDNVLMGLNIIDECIKRNLRIVVVSSAAAYVGVGTPTEGELHDGAPHEYNFAYAFAKRCLEAQIRAANYLNSIILYPSNLYGPYDTFGAGCHVIPSLMTRMMNDEKVEVRGSDSIRQFLLLEDFARIITMVLQDKSLTGELNVVPSTCYSIKDITIKLSEIMKYKGELVFKCGGERKIIGHNKFELLFPDFCFTGIDEGLRLFYEWARHEI